MFNLSVCQCSLEISNWYTERYRSKLGEMNGRVVLVLEQVVDEVVKDKVDEQYFLFQLRNVRIELMNALSLLGFTINENQLLLNCTENIQLAMEHKQPRNYAQKGKGKRNRASIIGIFIYILLLNFRYHIKFSFDLNNKILQKYISDKQINITNFENILMQKP